MYNCLIFGTGSAYFYRKYYLNYNYFNIIGMLDNNEKKWGELCDNVEIDNPQNIHNYSFDYIFIMSSFYKQIEQQLIELGVLKEKIINLYLMVNQNVSGRTQVANRFINFEEGYRQGIEIGGANNPINMIDKRIIILQVDYCDHSTKNDVFKDKHLVKVDIVDDGEKLTTIQDDSLDFIVACHMLEHCKNPIGTIRNFIAKVKTGGIIFLAVPDKRYSFDRNREITLFEHLVLDDMDPSDTRDREHFFNEKPEVFFTEQEINRVQKSIENDERKHFHVWDSNAFLEFIYEAKKYLNHTYSIELVGNLENGLISNEILCVLRKR